MKEQQLNISNLQQQHETTMSLLRQDLCEAQSQHRQEIVILEQKHSNMLTNASLRIRKATETTLELEASVREELLKEHQNTIDDLEKQVRMQTERANDAHDCLSELEERFEEQQEQVKANNNVLHLSTETKTPTSSDIILNELQQAESRIVELKNSLDLHMQENEDTKMMDAAVKVVGNHNVKQKIHFVEKLQNDRRELKYQNRKLTAELAKLKIEQAQSSFQKFRHQLHQINRGEPSPKRSPSTRSMRNSSSKKSSTKKSSSKNKKKSPTNRKSPSLFVTVAGNKENACNSPRSRKKNVGITSRIGKLAMSSLTSSSLHSPKSLV